MKVAPALVNKIDLTDTNVLSADKEYASKALREQIQETSTKVNIPKNSTHDRTIITCIGTYIKSEIWLRTHLQKSNNLEELLHAMTNYSRTMKIQLL